MDKLSNLTMIFVLVVLCGLSLYFGLANKEVLNLDDLEETNAIPGAIGTMKKLQKRQVDPMNGARNTDSNQNKNKLTKNNFEKKIFNNTSGEGLPDLKKDISIYNSKDILGEVVKDYQSTTLVNLRKDEKDIQNNTSNITSTENDSIYAMEGVKVSAYDYDTYEDGDD